MPGSLTRFSRKRAQTKFIKSDENCNLRSVFKSPSLFSVKSLAEVVVSLGVHFSLFAIKSHLMAIDEKHNDIVRFLSIPLFLYFLLPNNIFSFISNTNLLRICTAGEALASCLEVHPGKAKAILFL